MNNSVFLDSSILIEYYKGSQIELLDTLLNERSLESLTVSSRETLEGEIIRPEPEFVTLYISQTVLSEYLFQCLKLDTGKAPLTLKESGKIPEVISLSDHAEFLGQFTYLPDASDIIDLAPDMMEKYNLLPNDALILSICKTNGIKALASYDASDFIVPCQFEGIALLQNVVDFQAFKKAL